MQHQRDLLGPALLAVITFAVFSNALGNAFLNWDDIFFLHSNPAVLHFDLSELLRRPVVGIYHPVTMLSLALEARFFGLDPFWFHLDNLLLHTLNAVLVVAVLRRLCADHPFIPLLCGALFALHPLRVESVAWVAERKDVLSACFFLLTLLSHLHFRESGRRRWYAAALAFYALAILSKPMAVTAPVVLWITDGRLAGWPGRRALGEISPYLALALAAGLVSLSTQSHHPEEHLAIYDLGWTGRLGVGLESLVFYVSKTVLPTRLSAYYDVGKVEVEWYRYVLAGGVLAWMAIASIRRGEERPNYRWAALYFAVTVAPVLKIVPFGGNSLFNDRYTYLPGIGLVLALALPFRNLWRWSAVRRIPTLILWVAVVTALAGASHERVGVWRNSETFWKDVLKKYPGTAVALNNLGRYYLDEAGDLEAARRALEAATRARPGYANPELNLATVYERSGDLAGAAEHFQRALALAPYDAVIQVQVGDFHERAGEPQKAISRYLAALELRPDYAAAHNNLGLVYREVGLLGQARASYLRAIALAPALGTPRAGLADVLLSEGHLRQALEAYEAAQARGADVDPARLEKLRRRLGQRPPP